MDAFMKVYEHGTYYNPAQKHYREDIEVGCDRCLKTDIKVCLGYLEYDLCMTCVADIDEILDEEELDTDSY